MKNLLLVLISVLILFSMVIIGFPILWKYIGIKPETFGHYAFGSLILACLIGLLFVYIKIRELSNGNN